jgi:TetR/AcrR family transcriptional regulator, cholesterol catabolism regulator
MPKGIPLTEQELSRRRQEIAQAAVRLFVEKGFMETSMREIADAAGVGKSTLYDYFPNKDEILISFVVEEVRLLSTQAEKIIAQPLSAADKFRLILQNQMKYILANKTLYLKLSFETQRLSFESQQIVQQHRHAYQDMLCDLVQEGIQNGEFRAVNPLLVVQGMIYLLTSAVFTSRPTGLPDEMLSEAFDIIFKGLEAR